MKFTYHLLLAGLLVGCQTQEETKEARNELTYKTETDLFKTKAEQSIPRTNQPVNYALTANAKPAQPIRLIKTAELDLLSRNIQKSKLALDKIVEQNNGYYGNELFEHNRFRATYTLELRIPATHFQQVLSGISKGKDQLLAKNVHTKDVSEDYADTETRIQSKRAYLKRYQELLKQAKNVDELLRMEEEIRNLIEEIESREAHLHFLQSQISYSTVHITLTQKFKQAAKPDEPKTGFGSDALEALNNGWQGIQHFLLGLLKIWPVLLLFTATLYLLRKKFRAWYSNLRK